MGCSGSSVNNEKINLLEKEKNFLKFDLNHIRNIDIEIEDFIYFQEKIFIPNGDIYRYNYDRKVNTDNNIDKAHIYISVFLGEKITKKEAIATLEDKFIREKNDEIGILKISN